jgi:phage gp29-like protein
MMTKTATERTKRVLMAGALVLLSQAAWSEGGQDQKSGITEVHVIAQRLPKEPVDVKIETDIRSHVEELNRHLAEELAKRREAIFAAPIQLVVAEVQTRG